MFGKWSSTTKKINGSSSIVIAHTKLAGKPSDTELQGAQDVVQTARNWVSAALTLTAATDWSDTLKAAAASCFLTDAGGPTADQRQEINRVLQMTKSGICGSVEIKIGSPSANGYVNVHGFGKKQYKFGGRRVKNLQTGKTERIGRAHVDRDFVTNDKPRDCSRSSTSPRTATRGPSITTTWGTSRPRTTSPGTGSCSASPA